jgi:hypothetical protein
MLAEGPAGTSLDTLVQDIPYLMVIVKNGNIYINNEVDRVDGIFVAQPGISGGGVVPNTGIIDTCTNNGNVIFDGSSSNADALYARCAGTLPLDEFTCYAEYESCPAGYHRRRLTVEGALIAEKVRLNRLPGDVNTEAYKFGAPKTPANLRWDTRYKNNAAESINISPGLYFSLPPSAASGMDNKYDTYEVLPPVL